MRENYGYELPTPEHLFVPVKAQTGCARCGYARGHHPTARQLRDWQYQEADARRQEDRRLRQADINARAYDCLHGTSEHEGDR